MEQPQRPDGSNATAMGWLLIVVGVLAAFFSTMAESQLGWLFSFALANLGVALGVLLLSLGYLVRAIWFLPGREIPQEKAQAPSGQFTNCQWCGRNMFPYKACSTVSDEANRERAPRLRDENCQAEFRARGLMPEQSERLENHAQGADDMDDPFQSSPERGGGSAER